MLIYLTNGGPLDGSFVEVSDECSTYYDVRTEDLGTWHRYVEQLIPRSWPVTYTYFGERFDEEWWRG